MIKRSKGKGKSCSSMLFGVTVYKGNIYLIKETPTRVVAEFLI